MSEIKAIVIRGDFTDAEFAEMIAMFRRMDSARPGAFFEIVAVDPVSNSLEIADQTLRCMVPEMPGRTAEFAKLKQGWPGMKPAGAQTSLPVEVGPGVTNAEWWSEADERSEARELARRLRHFIADSRLMSPGELDQLETARVTLDAHRPRSP